MSSESSPSTTDDDAADSSSVTSLMFTLCLSAIVIMTYFTFRRTKRPTWKLYGVTEAKVSLLFWFGEDVRSKFTNLLNQYGSTVGINNGSQLIVLTSNIDLIKHVLIKDFSNFIERPDMFKSKSPFAKSIFFAKQKEWKRHRQIVSPTFRIGQLKNIIQLIDKSAQDMETYLEGMSRARKLVPIKDVAAQYTVEIIAKTAFGLDAHFIGNNDNEFLFHAKTMIRPLSGAKRVLFQVIDLIPQFINICKQVLPNLQFWDPISLEANEYFKLTLRETIAEKIKQKEGRALKRRVDFLDLLLKANDAAKAGKFDDDDDDNLMNNSAEGVVSALTDEELLGHCMLIIFAGMETTSITLQLSLYELARNPYIQEKAYREIQSVVQSTTPSSDELAKLHYLEQVINETLRLHPPVPLVSRKAQKTKTYNGVTIPKGASVIIPYFYIMAHPNLYPDPLAFDPDRFSPEEMDKRDLISFIPFGHGPRQCLGMKLAYLELKMALVYVLRKMRVVLNKETVPRMGESIRFKPQNLLSPVDEILLMFELRE